MKYALFNSCYCCPDSQDKKGQWGCYYGGEFHNVIEKNNDYIPHWCPRPDEDFIYDIQLNSYDPDKNMLLNLAMSHMSKEAKELIWMIFNRPDDFFKAFYRVKARSRKECNCCGNCSYF